MPHLLDSVKNKIIATSTIFVGIALAIGTFGAVTIDRMNANIENQYAESLQPILDLSTVRGAVSDAQRDFHFALEHKDERATQAWVDHHVTVVREGKDAWSDYYPAHLSDAEERTLAEKIDEGINEIHQRDDGLLALVQAGRYDEAATALTQYDHDADRLRTALKADVDKNSHEATVYVSDSQHHAARAFEIQITLILLAVAVALGVCVYLVRVITRPLKGAVNIASSIAAGNLGNRIDGDARGEFGELTQALMHMDGQLAGTVTKIQSTASSVAVAANEIANGNLNLSSRTEEQASALEETASSMTEVSVAAKQNAENARQANGLATNATALAHDGDNAVTQMVSTMHRISDSSSRIADITGVIEAIAFQTNILALNAAVEAARAGDTGKGFAVVAAEVRGLAQRSAAAAKEIKELITSSVSLVEDGARQAGEARDTMSHINTAVRRVTDIVAEIAAASDEQSRGIEQISTAISQMDDVTQQNAALVEQSAAAAQSLEEQAVDLRRSVSAFTVSSADALDRNRSAAPGLPRLA